MRYLSARQAWHDAFDCQTSQSDFAAIAGNSTLRTKSPKRQVDCIKDETTGKVTARIFAPTTYAVETRVGKSSTGRIMDALEKGRIQAVVHRIRQKDPLAYCWGMAAYAPPGARVIERAALLQHLTTKAEEFKLDFPHTQDQVKKLAFGAIQVCILRDVTGRRADLRDVRRQLGCTIEDWNNHWRYVWWKFERILDKLPGRALQPVFNEIRKHIDRETLA